jgi:hypothetical protein
VVDAESYYHEMLGGTVALRLFILGFRSILIGMAIAGTGRLCVALDLPRSLYIPVTVIGLGVGFLGALATVMGGIGTRIRIGLATADPVSLGRYLLLSIFRRRITTDNSRSN